jgi:hypothetical protein
VTDTSPELLRELYEPFEAIQPLFVLEDRDRALVLRMNESVMADLLGDEAVPAPSSNLARETLDLMYSISEVNGPPHRFAVFKKMFQRNSRGFLSRGEHLASTYYLFVHECYVFEERLKGFFRAIDGFAKRFGLECGRILKLHNKVFSSALKQPGEHVHQADVLPRELRRVRLLETLLLGERMGQSAPHDAYRLLERQAVKEARRQWASHCDKAQIACFEILRATYRATKPVWSQIAVLGNQSSNVG